MKYLISLILLLCFIPLPVSAEERDDPSNIVTIQETTASDLPTVYDILFSAALQGTGQQPSPVSDIDADGQITAKDADYLTLYLEKTENGMHLPLEEFMQQALFPFHVTDVREYRKKSFTYAHHNQPYFDVDPAKIPESLEYYSELDSLGRCGSATAIISPDTMPSEERGPIGMIKPAGWQTIRYDFVDGGYLYNRCHLIGYQLAGENANPLNLITGTRYLNTIGMLPFENRIAAYVQRTGNRVLYRVTPIFVDDELVARGVLLEAFSLEDRGKGLCFAVYCYNVQPGITINYQNGESWLVDEAPSVTDPTTETTMTTTETAAVTDQKEQTYILNTRSKRFHLPECDSVRDIKAKNKQTYSGTRDELIEKGYKPCGACKP